MTDLRRCAYCKSEGQLTREHLWPAALHRRLVAVNQQTVNSFWLRRIERFVENEPTIRDVCQQCNNGTLSDLDSYVCDLFDKYFFKILQREEKIKFIFDYHKLKRWLLKICYNSARIHESMDLFAYEHLLSYINGQSESAGRSVQLFVELSYPGVVPRDRLADPVDKEMPVIWEPQENRCGHIYFEVPNVGKKVLRAVHLRSYSFYLAFWEPTGKSAVRKNFSEMFLSLKASSALLRPSNPSVELVCGGVDAWQSYDGARENRLVSGMEQNRA